MYGDLLRGGGRRMARNDGRLPRLRKTADPHPKNPYLSTRSDPWELMRSRILCLFGVLGAVCRFVTWRRAVGGGKMKNGWEINPETADSCRRKSYLTTRGGP